MSRQLNNAGSCIRQRLLSTRHALGALPAKALLAAFIFELVALIGSGCSRGGERKPTGARGPMAVPVTVAVAIEKDFPIRLDTIGTVHAYASVSVKPRVDGQLGQVGFKQGEEVRKGDLIFKIEPRAFEVALQQAQAVLARDVASLQNAESEMRRTDELSNTKAVSAALVELNRSKVAALKATVEADKAAVEMATVQLSYCFIRSPIDGRVGLLLVDVGNVIKNNDTILAVINQVRPIYADFAVPQQFLREVRNAQQASRLGVSAALPQNTNQLAAGHLDVINNQIDPATGTILLRATFPNEDELLWPGLLANVSLTLGLLTNAVVVPSPAVQSSQSGEFVFIVKPDMTVEKSSVVLGPVRGGEAVIQRGVRAGQIVVTDGQLRLVPGATVRTNAPDVAVSPTPDGRRS